KNKPATMKPIVIAPERKSISIALRLLIPDEAEQQNHHRGERKDQAKHLQRHRFRKQDEIDEDNEVAATEQHEAQGAPEQQSRPGSQIASRQQPGAGAARQETEQI